LTKPRSALIALAALALGAGAAQIGVAQADNSTGTSGTTAATGTSGSTQLATIVVNGSDVIQLPSGTDTATVQSNYQTALGDALDNASQKASFIAQKIGATLGSITNVTETSDSSNLCQGPVVYANASKPAAPAHKHKTRAAPLIRAIIDPIGSCSVEADVTVTYAMTPA
jgi:uncharacterized protein YggE